MRYLADVATLTLDPDLCSGCGTCPQVCPRGVMTMENDRARIVDRDLCMECGACARNCPTRAITVDAGVGCASAVISSAFGRKNSCCTLDDYPPGQPGCGCGSGGDSSSGKPRRDGCC